MDLDNIGLSTVKDSTAFKKIQFFSKTNPTSLFSVKSDFQNSFNKLSTYYRTDLDLNQSYTYGMDRQHNYTSLSATLPMFSTLLDKVSVNKFFDYNFEHKNNSNNLNINRVDYDSTSNSTLSAENAMVNYSKLLPSTYNRLSSLDFSTFLQIPNSFSVLGAENDSKQYSNSLKLSLNQNHKKKLIHHFENVSEDLLLNNNTLEAGTVNNSFSNSTYNTENTLKFKDFKSSNAQFLGSERTVRLLNNLNSNSFKWNSSSTPNAATAVSNSITAYGGNQNSVYSSSLSNWSDSKKHAKFANNIV